MSESSWLCQNRKCGLMFGWDHFHKKAGYTLVSPQGEEREIEKPLCGGTKPSCCPECNGTEIDSLEG